MQFSDLNTNPKIHHKTFQNHVFITKKNLVKSPKIFKNMPSKFQLVEKFLQKNTTN